MNVNWVRWQVTYGFELHKYTCTLTRTRTCIHRERDQEIKQNRHTLDIQAQMSFYSLLLLAPHMSMCVLSNCSINGWCAYIDVSKAYTRMYIVHTHTHWRKIKSKVLAISYRSCNSTSTFNTIHHIYSHNTNEENSNMAINKCTDKFSHFVDNCFRSKYYRLENY